MAAKAPNGRLIRLAVAKWLESPGSRRQSMVNILTLGVFLAWMYAGMTGNAFAESAERMALLLLGLKGGAMIANGNGR